MEGNTPGKGNLDVSWYPPRGKGDYQRGSHQHGKWGKGPEGGEGFKGVGFLGIVLWFFLLPLVVYFSSSHDFL